MSLAWDLKKVSRGPSRGIAQPCNARLRPCGRTSHSFLDLVSLGKCLYSRNFAQGIAACSMWAANLLAEPARLLLQSGAQQKERTT